MYAHPDVARCLFFCSSQYAYIGARRLRAADAEESFSESDKL